MSEIVTVRLSINGHFPNDTFPDWIVSRAKRLNLSGCVEPCANHLVKVLISGDPILIDAMEVACSLGPIDAQVHSIERQAEQTPEEHYRQPARFIRY